MFGYLYGIPFWSCGSRVVSLGASSEPVHTTHPLKLVVRCAPYVFMGILYDRDHPLRSLPLSEVWCKPLAQPLDSRLTLETWQTRAKHELDCADELIDVRPQSEEALDAELRKEAVTLRAAAAHEHHHLVVEFERVRLELDSARPDVK
jgi:hypothetical protein